MEEAFNKLKKEGKNNVDCLVQWMKDAKIVTNKAKEETAKKYFEGCDQANVEYAKFQEVIKKVADENKTVVENLHKELVATSTKFLDALKAGASTVADKLHLK